MAAARRIARGVVLGALLTLSACSLLVDFADECTADADCAGKGGGFVCREHLCVSGEAASDVAEGDGRGDTVPPGDVAGPGPTIDELLEGPCDRLLGVAVPSAGERLPEGTILLGALVPRTGQLADLGPYLDQAIELALGEVNQVGGLLGRAFAVLSCDSGTDPTQAIAAATHLVEVAHVPAIIGEISSGITIAVFNEVAREPGVLVMSPAASAASSLPDDGLIWRTSPSATLQARAIAGYLLAHLAEWPKVAIVHRQDAWGDLVSGVIFETYCQVAECGEDEFQSHVYADATAAEDFSTILASHLVAFQPDVVVLVAYINDGAAFVNAAAAAGLERFVTADGIRDELAFERITDDAVLCRLFGVSFASPTGPLYDAFRFRYRERWQQEPVPYTAHTYDAVFALAYAAVAVRGEDLSGARLAEGLARLSSGATIRAGGSDWNAGVQALLASADARIDFDGASGPLDFDAAGEVTGDVEGWKFHLSDESVESLGIVYTATGDYRTPRTPAADPVCDALLAP